MTRRGMEALRNEKGLVFYAFRKCLVFFFHLSATLLEGFTLYGASRVGSYCQALRHDTTSFPSKRLSTQESLM